MAHLLSSSVLLEGISHLSASAVGRFQPWVKGPPCPSSLNRSTVPPGTLMIPDGAVCACALQGRTDVQTGFSVSCTGVKLKGFWKKGCTSKAKLPWETSYGEANCPRCGNPRLSHRVCLSSPGQAASSLLSGKGDGR